MQEHLQILLEGFIAQPDVPVSKLPMLTAAEQRMLLEEWNQTSADYPKDKCIHQLFEEQVRRRPEAVAVVFEGHKLTYRELNLRANSLARYLKKLRVIPDSLVGVWMERSLDTVVSLLAVLKAGAAYVPLDPSFPRDRLEFMVEDSQLGVLLTHEKAGVWLTSRCRRTLGWFASTRIGRRSRASLPMICRRRRNPPILLM